MKTVHESICANRKVHRKIMSMSQLELLLKLTAKYEFVLPCSCISTVQASAIIRDVLDNPPPLRKRPYSYDRLLQGFMDKYPEVYHEVMCRDL